MWVKLINNKIEEAPNNIDNIINANLDENLMKSLGYKIFVPAERLEDHFYEISYQETKTHINEVLTDITEDVHRSEYIKQTQEKIEELKHIQFDYMLKQDEKAIKMIKDIINGLQLTI